jgi:hypothetical protein
MPGFDYSMREPFWQAGTTVGIAAPDKPDAEFAGHIMAQDATLHASRSPE